MTHKILACLDGSAMVTPITEAAAWVSRILAVPPTFLHVLETTGAGADRELSAAGTDEDQAVSLTRLRGQQALDVAKARLQSGFGITAATRMMQGNFVDIVRDYQNDTRVLIAGKRGMTPDSGGLGANLTALIRASHRPTMIVTETFVPPKKVMLAYDGSDTMVKAVNTIAQSPIFKDLECHVVMVGAETDEHRKQLIWAEKTLLDHNIATKVRLMVEKEFHAALNRYAAEQSIDMIVMGAYSHNPAWQFIMGSKTATLLNETQMTLLVLR